MSRYAASASSLALAATLLVGCAAPAVMAQSSPADRVPAVVTPPAVSIEGAAADVPAVETGLRPLPGPMPYGPAFRRAVANGTRTYDGRPGPNYWVNRAAYDLTARLDPATKRLDGTATIRYTNHSPNTLPVLVLELGQNFHAPGVIRLDPAEITGGVTLDRFAVNGQALGEAAGRGSAGYRINGTVMMVRLPQPLAPGATVAVDAAWHFTMPQEGMSGRMGYVPAGDRFGRDPSMLWVAYWYPQVAVYDDVRGWNTDPFLGPAEFYDDTSDYTYTVEVPAGWVVQGTGDVTNPQDVFTPTTRERLARAAASDAPVEIAASTDTPTAPGTMLRYRLNAPNVRDVAFSVTKGYAWDAARADVGDRDGDGRDDYALSQALYRPEAFRWKQAVRYNQNALTSHSAVSGLVYPWPHMTAVEGDGMIGGGMEFPMMTVISNYTDNSDADLNSVVAHEIGHMWNPMLVGNDERRYAWQDEGFTMYHENQAEKRFSPQATSDPLDFDREDAPSYVRMALSGEEQPMMLPRHQHTVDGNVASYDKPAAVLVALRELIGEDAFNRGWQDYHRTWVGKHPMPYDFFGTMQRAAGRDLSWFWQAWFFQTWQLDQAVENVTTMGDRSTVSIRDLGQVPMPVWLTLTYADGRTERRDVPVETWLTGATTATVAVPGRIVKAEIDARQMAPDVNRANNVWPR